MTFEHAVSAVNEIWVWCRCGEFWPASDSGNPQMLEHIEQANKSLAIAQSTVLQTQFTSKSLATSQASTVDKSFSYHSPLLQDPPASPKPYQDGQSIESIPEPSSKKSVCKGFFSKQKHAQVPGCGQTIYWVEDSKLPLNRDGTQHIHQ